MRPVAPVFGAGPFTLHNYGERIRLGIRTEYDRQRQPNFLTDIQERVTLLLWGQCRLHFDREIIHVEQDTITKHYPL